ncbi:tRNA pseudouridine(55) synthase TruB [Buchnera aphidicola (Taiwanaphis decaspermi)]|uniref:tRNA pseudouridine(55) synthase TruB n=1 Tax=Buchnera aphidicola TaxID=9 RepID=UPI0031B85F5C
MIFFNKKVNRVLLINKKKGHSSNYTLQKVKNIFKVNKAGHTGTLDPLATGMLPICFGKSTKFSEFLIKSDKKYIVTAKLGEKTPTGDSESLIISKKDVYFTNIKLKKVIYSFIGKINQIPPMYSAIKYKGIPLYKYARKGINIKLKKRVVKIYSIFFYRRNSLLYLEISCSKGTYIRSLINDIGDKLECGAHVIFLHRSEISSYPTNKMVSLKYLKYLRKKYSYNIFLKKMFSRFLIPVENMIDCRKVIHIDKHSYLKLKQGQIIKSSYKYYRGIIKLINNVDNVFVGLAYINIYGYIRPYKVI